MDKTRLILGTGAATAAAGLVVLLLLDPTRGDIARLDAMATAARAGPQLSALAQNVGYNEDFALLTQRPIFVMTTGAGAYKEKTFQLFGVSISPGRKAVLVSIDGAPAAWVSAGQITGDVQLIDADVSHARFDTPLGERTVSINDPAPASAPGAGANTGQ